MTYFRCNYPVNDFTLYAMKKFCGKTFFWGGIAALLILCVDEIDLFLKIS